MRKVLRGSRKNSPIEGNRTENELGIVGDKLVSKFVFMLPFAVREFESGD